jgi:hypothetical protein
VGGEGKCKGRKAVDLDLGTRVDRTFATMKEELPSQVSGFPILINWKALSSYICICMGLY